jgi:vacuolar-type H+-ATPase subunit H
MQLRGYNKEVAEDSEGETVKVYTHKWCSQLLEWKEAHSEGWKKVMDGLVGHFRAIALAEQRRKEEEERARREAVRKAEEARRQAEDARRQAEEEHRARSAAFEEQRQREAEEEAARVAAEEKAAAAAARSQLSLKHKVGKKFSAIKQGMKNTMKGCKGNKNKDVDEDATEKNLE